MERTLAIFKGQDFLVQKVEYFNPHGNVRKDLYGFIDVLAIHPYFGTIGVQVCGGTSDFSAHKKKIEGDRREATILWLLAGNRFILQGHRKLKSGWVSTEKEYTLTDFPELTKDALNRVRVRPQGAKDWMYPSAEDLGPKRKSCQNCGHRVARYKFQIPAREHCRYFSMGVKGVPRAWEECRGENWIKTSG